MITWDCTNRHFCWMIRLSKEFKMFWISALQFQILSLLRQRSYFSGPCWWSPRKKIMKKNGSWGRPFQEKGPKKLVVPLSNGIRERWSGFRQKPLKTDILFQLIFHHPLCSKHFMLALIEKDFNFQNYIDINGKGFNNKRFQENKFECAKT